MMTRLVGQVGRLVLGSNPLDGARVRVVRQSSQTGMITVEILEPHGAYHAHDEVHVQPFEFRTEASA